MEISPATSVIDPVTFLGIAGNTIANGVNGKVIYFGYLGGLDTRGTAPSPLAVGDEDWQVGNKLFIHPTVPGKLTNIEPQAPNVKICVASVINRNQTAGVIFIRPTTNLKLDKLTDVQLATPANGEVLAYNGVTGRWENQNLIGDINAVLDAIIGGE
jgi:hypothetical protein